MRTLSVANNRGASPSPLSPLALLKTGFSNKLSAKEEPPLKAPFEEDLHKQAMLANMAELRSLKEAMKGSTPRVLFNRSLRHKQIFTSLNDNSTKATITE